MIGEPTIKKGFIDSFPKMNQKTQKFVLDCFNDFVQWGRFDDDFLYPYFHQVDCRCEKPRPDVEGIAWSLIVSMALKGDIFMIYIEKPDKTPINSELSLIEKWNIDGVKIVTNNTPQGSDGFLELLEDIELIQLVLNEDDFNKQLPRITIKKGTIIPIEIGTCSVLKISTYLSEIGGGMVARMPYDFSCLGVDRIALIVNKEFIV